jgi:hypothetical protein
MHLRKRETVEKGVRERRKEEKADRKRQSVYGANSKKK